MDLATLTGISKFSGGQVQHFPGYHVVHNTPMAAKFEAALRRYFTRKIGFEAVMRIRYILTNLVIESIWPFGTPFAFMLKIEAKIDAIATPFYLLGHLVIWAVWAVCTFWLCLPF